VAQAVASADKKMLEIEAEEVERRIEGRAWWRDTGSRRDVSPTRAGRWLS
jgi:hypothetical protein